MTGPSKLLGSAEPSRDGRTVWVRLSRKVDPKRERRDLRDILGPKMSDLPEVRLAQGREWAHKITVEALAKKVAPPKPTAAASKHSFAGYAASWRDVRKRVGAVEDPTDDYRRLRHHVFPLLGDVPVVDVTREHIEDVVTKMDEKIKDGTSWKTVANAWSALRTLFRDAVRSKHRELRVRTTDPTADVAPPERGDKRAKPWLYPSEYVTLVTSPGLWQAEGRAGHQIREAAHRWARLFTLAVYLGMRAGELRVIEWSDIDFDHWTVAVNKAAVAHTAGKKTKKPKSGVQREYEIEPAVRPLLLVMRAEAGGKSAKGRVVAVPHESELADRLRKYLGLAGVTREALFADDAVRGPITFHDLRATWMTWRALREDGPFQLQRAAGHKSLNTTQGYIRTAEDVRKVAGAPFPPVPPMVVGRELTRDERKLLGDVVKSLSPIDGAEAASALPPALAHWRPISGPPDANDAFFLRKEATPMGIERDTVGKTTVKKALRGPIGPPVDRDRPPSPAASGSGDAVTDALRRALDEAIAKGDRHAAGQLAADLASRAVGPTAKVIQLKRR